MELFVKVMNAVNDIIWHPVMCVFLMCAAVWFTVRLRGIQVRRFKDMVKCLTEKGDNKKDTGLSAFQAFATTVGGRVGTGNIAGTATAIFIYKRSNCHKPHYLDVLKRRNLFEEW